MKVKELIKALKKQDPEKMVVIQGYEGGVDEVRGVEPIKIKLNANTAWYYGKHQPDEKRGDCDAIHIN